VFKSLLCSADDVTVCAGKASSKKTSYRTLVSLKESLVLSAARPASDVHCATARCGGLLYHHCEGATQSRRFFCGQFVLRSSRASLKPS